MNAKKYINLGKKLFPINRSLSGDGNLKTLKIIKSQIPYIKIKSFPSRKKVFDWIIPDEWNVKNAFVKDKYGKKIIDFKKNNLHLIGYSSPIKKRIDKNDLMKKIYSLKKLPNAIPYITSYYNKYWGFCITNNQKKIILKNYKKDDVFDVLIDSKFNKKGSLSYGEVILPGKSKKEILISTYICHPSMANNELSGPLVAIALTKFFKKIKLKKTLRILFLPETIGSIAYINKNLKKLRKNVIGGYVLTCIGDNKSYSYLSTKYDNALSDKAAKDAFKKLGIKFKKYSFLKRGSDERQYNSPGVDLNIGSIMRSKYGEYKEYHTSLDNFNLVNEKGLSGGYRVAKQSIINLLETKEIQKNKKKLNKTKNPKFKYLCEPNLGKRGLYNLLGSKEVNYNSFNRKILNFLQFCDGKNNIKKISQDIKLPSNETRSIYKLLKKNRLVF
tara:strand:- start:669 stop:1997 length:1329 start_codon:yes stop_codon:yes gene_type:complete